MLRRVVSRVLSTLRVWKMRLAGYSVGKSVRIGRSSVRGARVRIGDRVHIGNHVAIIGEEIEIAHDVRIEGEVSIQARQIGIGPGTLIESGVTIGGLQTRHSRVSIGANCVVLHQSYLNTTFPLTIEDDVGIGGYCMIFTHGLWQSAFEGYPISYAPVTIHRAVWLPWHVFVMPGVEIGEGATIGAGSVVLDSVPPRSLAVGSPARVIKSPPSYPRTLSNSEMRKLVERFLRDLAEEMQARGSPATVLEGSNGILLETPTGRVGFGDGVSVEGDTVELVLGSRPRARFWIDLLSRDWNLELSRSLHSELRMFARRYGVRLLPNSG